MKSISCRRGGVDTGSWTNDLVVAKLPIVLAAPVGWFVPTVQDIQTLQTGMRGMRSGNVLNDLNGWNNLNPTGR